MLLDALSLEVFATRLEGALSNLVKWKRLDYTGGKGEETKRKFKKNVFF